MMNPMGDAGRLDELLGALRDGQLDDEQVAELENLLDGDPQAMARYLNYAQLCADLRHCHGSALRVADLASLAQPMAEDVPPAAALPSPRGLWRASAAVAGLVALAASLAMWLYPRELRPIFMDQEGLAVLTLVADAQWEGDPSLSPGVPLQKGVLELRSGLAQIEFFRGAVVILEGPAKLELVADDRAILHYGTLRSHVSPPAQGFVIETPQAKLIDHGTEFGLSVDRAGETEVHVFEGNVELQGAVAHQLFAGQGVRFDGAGKNESIPVRPESFLGPAAMAKTSDAEVLRRRNEWAAHAAQLARDPAAVAYFTFEHPDAWGRTLKDESTHARDAAIIGSQWSEGRWPGKGALEFKRTGDRVRIDLPDVFDAFTLVAWLRIDGFDRWLSSPLLTDTYEQGRPHWHVTWDGEIVLGIGSDGNYFSPKGLLGIKDLGRWIQLATVVDPVSKTVTHYLDGLPVHQASLRLVQQFRIAGPAGVGNWSRPGVYRDNDIRSLNGRMDEFGIFSRAFTPDEIRTMYEKGKPTS